MADTQDQNEPDQATDSQQAKKKLFLAVAILAIAMVIVMVFQILPAKYGIDLTGYGTYVGLMKVYESSKQLEQMRNTLERQDQTKIEIAAGEDLEFKLFLVVGDKLNYTWKSDQGEVYSEFHGEPMVGHSAVLETFEKITAQETSGDFQATFEGTHGWYWRNDQDSPVTITLDTQGKYNVIGEMEAAYRRE